MSPLQMVLPSRHLLLLAILLLPLHAHAVLNAILGEKFPFKVTVADGKNLAEEAEESIRTQRSENNEFEDFKQPQAVARFDRDILDRWMRSQGYFDAKVNTEFGDEKIIYRVEPGPRYLIKTITLKLPEGIEAPPVESLPVQEGDALKAQAVLNTTSALQEYVRENYCLYDVQANYDAEINRATTKAFVTFSVKPSPSVVFGEPEISGLESIEPGYLRNYLTFEDGECFRRRQVELSRLALLQTNLFTRIDVQVEQPQDGEVKVIFDATERRHRTIKAGVGYDTNTRAGVSLGWEHRNLNNRGERLSIDARLSEIRKNVLGELTVPHFRRKNQVLTLRADVEREETTAYENSRGLIGARLQRSLHEHITGSVGIAYEYSQQVNLNEAADEQPTNSDPDQEPDDSQDERPRAAPSADTGVRKNYSLLSFPLRLDYINNNNPLNPTRGWSLGVATEPFFSLENTGDRFVKSTIAASTYFTARDMATSPTLALRAATGVISGSPRREVPASHRFYVGGGGSVRGYAYQTVGDLEPIQDGRPVKGAAPAGGLTFSEVSLELRMRLSQSWGAVIFADGGYSYADRRPSFGDEFLWGAGIGLRYFTSFAPIRFDVATPLNRDDPQRQIPQDGAPGNTQGYKPYDDPVQIYISIGQAF